MKTTDRGVGSKADLVCKECGNSNPKKFVWRGGRRGGKTYQCKICNAWGTTGAVSNQYDYTFTDNGESAQVDAQIEKRIVSEKDLIEYLKIDTSVWRVKKFVVGKSDGYRKDRQVKWVIVDGQVVTGEVNDSGKLLIQPLFTVKVWLERKTPEIRNGLIVDDLKKDAIKFVPKYLPRKYPKYQDGVLLELGIFDFHFGRLCWGKESGVDFDVKIAESILKQTLAKLLSYAKGFNVSRILIPFGGDYFNSNSKGNTTVSGTQMQEDTRYAKTFKLGRQLAVSIIDECSQIAPVDVLLVKGNHDEERLFYLGDALECWYNKNPNVAIDNSPKSRKYYIHGETLLGFVHGNEAKLDKLPMLMALEVPALWEKSTYREFHTGDKHHRFLAIENGVVIRILSSLTAPDQWTYDKGFVGSLRATESFVFHPHDGLVGQFTAAVPHEEYR